MSWELTREVMLPEIHRYQRIKTLQCYFHFALEHLCVSVL